jgi:hypothetical protein
MMNDDDILPLEAMHLLSHASDELLRLAARADLDLNRLARSELRARGLGENRDCLQHLYIHKTVRAITF